MNQSTEQLVHLSVVPNAIPIGACILIKKSKFNSRKSGILNSILSSKSCNNVNITLDHVSGEKNPKTRYNFNFDINSIFKLQKRRLHDAFVLTKIVKLTRRIDMYVGITSHIMIFLYSEEYILTLEEENE